MNRRHMNLIAMTALIGSVLAIPTRADIIFTGGGADVTWYYQSQADAWFTVFRNKGTTVATGLDSAFPAFTGIVGHGDDWNFNSALRIQVDTSASITSGGTDFFITSASGSPLLSDGSTPDLGIRTRLRENEVALGIGSGTASNQFASFRLTLNLANSTFNGTPLNQAGSPFVGLFDWDAFNTPVDLLNSATPLLSADFGNFTHIHRNWGFSEYGNYSLAFEVQGVGGAYGDTASVGASVINFEVVPEPSTLAFLLVGFGLGGIARARRLRGQA
ncbi:MAG TPA: PEP-CTERM sorting domain-containing protein [Kiritimatiellia bacterium]|nr:PEP-CTERM sorting domain-containing protein [Kiritimatiellia bacterium]HMO98353.1 PEP-CTERM sorting domain-containing protein [Kiritimatiellia bacterium]HMP96701.1 PEP-CTERM sorting domain-containing protein [Kiritimatiellia bacterium]